jgi:hypothetical protein
MSVELIQGYTGSGKSYCAMCKVADHLADGGIVGLNFHLKDDWAYVLAFHDKRVQRGELSLHDAASSLHRRCFYIGHPQTLEQLATPAYLERCESWCARRRERKALIVLDEAQLYLNTRNWRENFHWLQLGTQHRKMGLDLILLAHHISWIDNMVVTLISFISRSVNLYEELRIPGSAVRFPFPFFILISKPRLGGKPSFMFRPLRSRISELYDSYEIFGFDSLSSVIESQGIVTPARSALYAKYGWPLPAVTEQPSDECGRPPVKPTWPGKDSEWRWNLFEPAIDIPSRKVSSGQG